MHVMLSFGYAYVYSYVYTKLIYVYPYICIIGPDARSLSVAGLLHCSTCGLAGYWNFIIYRIGDLHILTMHTLARVPPTLASRERVSIL